MRSSNRWKKINVNKVVQAGTDAVKAISLSDADIAAMSRNMEWMDTHNPDKPDTDWQAPGEADRKYQKWTA